MDYGNQNQGDAPMHYQFEQAAPPRNGMVTAASVLGLATIVTTILCTVYIPFITGSLAILFALLSKGNSDRMNPTATSGVTSAVVGLIMNVMLIITAIVLYFTNPTIKEQADKLFKQRYGVTIEEWFWEGPTTENETYL
ncbi:MAG: hypothetical protein K2K87_02310 [Lachnospiraceae bacterium]|nr:hypothetical protein [Lachnospiraceae bacterium]